ncbi:hypothetical protein GCM10020358_12980 [Amorphoplanes nipponensis]|uniref:non-specific serine/threonine protein kinase n=1 Tax=Actinoplanes nipponensis TaxID=135950 RepID=A0A919JJH4_9ACTN|nr:hypothetical protein Ani05nite_41310 [Actinoplanes nipponensis]
MAGRYRLLRALAAGGMGRVWLAADELTSRQVAVKKCALPPGLTPAQQDLVRDLTLREARALARVRHRNVIRILDVLPGHREPWIVMEYVASRTLLEVIQESGPLPPERAAAVGLAVLKALNAAGRAGVLHLDVKPANVLIGDDGRIVLADFGPAGTDAGVRALTGAGILLGSPKYIAPERLVRGVSTPQADLWSLGATLYHAVEGRPPYVRATVDDTLRALAGSPPDPLARAGPLTGVLEGLLRRDPVQRLSASEVEAQLRRVAAPDAGPGRADRRMAAAAVFVLLAALGGTAAAVRYDDRPGNAPAVAAFPPARAPFVLPRDFRWWTETGQFRVAVPVGWRRGRDAGALVFRAAAGAPVLRVGRWDPAPRDVVAALVAEENAVSLASYRRLRIEALGAPAGAVWEYTFRDPGGAAMHGLRRVLSVGDRIYLVEWQAPAAAWAGELPRLAVVLDSFGPPPAAQAGPQRRPR